MSTLSKYRALPPCRRLLLIRALMCVLLARAALALVSFSTIRRWLACIGSKARGDVAVKDACWAVLASSRRVPGTRCLARSIALDFLLRKAGYRTELRIGVSKLSNGPFRAHAWVMCDGEPALANEDLSQYTVLQSV